MNKVDETNFEQVVLQSAKPILVDFYADWCRPCQMLTPLLEKLQKHIDIVKLDTEACPILSAEYNISGLPTLIFFKDGQEAKRIMGLQRESVFLDAIKEISA